MLSHQTIMFPDNFELLDFGELPGSNPGRNTIHPVIIFFYFFIPKVNVCKVTHAKIASFSVNLNSSNLYSR